MPNGKYYDHTTEVYLDNYTDGIPTAEITPNVFTVESYIVTNPTPDYPLDVVSLGQPKNLFDNAAITQIDVTGAGDMRYGLMFTNLNGTYTISSTPSSENLFYKKIVDGVYQVLNMINQPKTVTVNQAETLLIYSTSNLEFSRYLVQLERGTVATEYEPYRTNNQVKVITSGKNIDNLKTDYIDISYLSVGQSITMRFNKPVDYNILYKIADSGGAVSIWSVPVNSQDTTLAITHVLTQNNIDCGKLFIVNRQLSKNVIPSERASYELQIELGTTATDYEPYYEPTTIDLTGHEPLRKIGDVSDYVDYENGKIIRNVSKVTFTGTENWYSYGAGYALSNWANRTEKMHPNSEVGYKSNMFIENANYNAANNSFMTNYTTSSWIIISPNIEGVSSVETFKTWLAEQYANGTPVTVYYQLAIPIYEDIVLPELSIPYGNYNTIVTDGSLFGNFVKY